MLINTLFLFLRELLPLFLLCAMLIVLMDTVQLGSRVLASGLIAGAIVYLGLQLALDDISQWLDGAGVEWLFFAAAAIQILLFFMLLLALTRCQMARLSAVLAVILMLFTATSLVNFMTFLVSLWSRQVFHQPLVLGAVIGAGISASIAVLFYFLLYGLRRVLPIMLLIMPAVFFTGQLASTVNLLEQVGLIDSGVLWSTQAWLPDQSAIALVLAALLGYEATPSYWQVVIYALVLVVLLAIIGWRREALRRMLTQREEIS